MPGRWPCRRTAAPRAAPHDYGFGLVLDRNGKPSLGEATIARAYQEHGEIRSDAPLPMAACSGTRSAGGAEPHLPDRRGA